MTDTHTAPSRLRTPAAEGLAALTDTLARDLAAGTWRPGPLERRLARLLLVGAAGDGELTADRVRAVAWEGHVALTQAGEGRLARLFTQLLAVAQDPESAAGPAGDTARALLERLAEEGPDARVRS
ncbi:hypothetical protein AB0J21_01475 [Streptomyces sp. NPDC049954]|uniref:hypothetical protein n=1 Tax=Streptomyces sp. NPDC049954 TaxID=3155779 RepID=UPI00342B134B